MVMCTPWPMPAELCLQPKPDTPLPSWKPGWAMSHFHPLLYGQSVTVYTDHSAVRAILDAPNPSGKHARWWTCVYGRGVRDVRIRYRPGKINTNADVLSRGPHTPAPKEGVAEGEFQVALVHGGDTSIGEMSVDCLLQSEPACTLPARFTEEQCKDPALREIFRFLEEGVLPEDATRARKLARACMLSSMATCITWILSGIIRSSWWFPGTCGSRLWMRHTMDTCQHTSPASGSSTRCGEGGGGKACSSMRRSLCEAVQSVRWCVVGEGYNVHHCIRSQCPSHSKSSE